MPLSMKRKVNLRVGAIVPSPAVDIQNCLLLSNEHDKFEAHQIREYGSYADVNSDFTGLPEARFAKYYFESYSNSLKKPSKLLIGENYSLSGTPASITSGAFGNDAEADLVQKLSEISNLEPTASVVESQPYDTTGLLDTLKALNNSRPSIAVGEAYSQQDMPEYMLINLLRQIDNGTISVTFDTEDHGRVTATSAPIDLTDLESLDEILAAITAALNAAIDDEDDLDNDFQVGIGTVGISINQYCFSVTTVGEGDEYSIVNISSPGENGIAQLLNFTNQTIYVPGETLPNVDLSVTFYKPNDSSYVTATAENIDLEDANDLDGALEIIKGELNDAIEAEANLGGNYIVTLSLEDSQYENLKKIVLSTEGVGRDYDIISVSSVEIPGRINLASLLMLTQDRNATYTPGNDSPKPDMTLTFLKDNTPVSATAENIDFSTIEDDLQKRLNYLALKLNEAIKNVDDLGDYYSVSLSRENLTNNRFAIRLRTVNQASDLQLLSAGSSIPSDMNDQLAMVLGLDGRSNPSPSIVSGEDSLSLGGVLDQYAEDRDDWWCVATAESVYANNIEIANWVTEKNDDCRFIFICHDMNGDAKTSRSNGNTIGYQMFSNNSRGVTVLFGDEKLAGFVAGIAGSIDYNSSIRTIFSGKRNANLDVTVTSDREADCLESNYYNYYCSYSSTMPRYNCFETGHVNFFVDGNNIRYLDTAFNQIWLLREFQLVLMNLLTSNQAVPFNQRGLDMLAGALDKPITKALENGVIAPGVDIDDDQKQIINSMVGKDVTDNIYKYGYYLYLKPATAAERYDRCYNGGVFFYTDAGGVQRINLTSNVIL